MGRLVVGIVSGTIQLQTWRRERKLAPAKEKLFAEALRDRKGEYTEAQILELTTLHKKLETATKREIPRQARRIYIENQIDALDESLIRDVRRRADLMRELGGIKKRADEIPSEISDAIRSSVAPLAVQRQRRQLRLVVLATICVLALIFPEIVSRSRNVALFSLGDWPRPYGGANVVGYVIGVALVVLVLFAMSGERLENVILARPAVSVAISLVFLIVWLISTVILTATFDEENRDSFELSIVSAVALALFIRINSPIIFEWIKRRKTNKMAD